MHAGPVTRTDTRAAGFVRALHDDVSHGAVSPTLVADTISPSGLAWRLKMFLHAQERLNSRLARVARRKSQHLLLDRVMGVFKTAGTATKQEEPRENLYFLESHLLDLCTW